MSITCQTFEGGINTDGCRKSYGSLNTVYIAKHQDITTCSGATTGLIDAITMSAGTYFYEFEPNHETSSFNENGTSSNGGPTFEQIVSLEFLRNSRDTRNKILMLGEYELMVIVKDFNDIYWLVGKDGKARLRTATGASNATIGEYNRWTIELAAMETEPAFEVSSTLIDTIVYSA